MMVNRYVIGLWLLLQPVGLSVMAQGETGYRAKDGGRGVREMSRTDGDDNGNRKGRKDRRPKVFDMAQTISSGAQTHTIAFSALAFYTGSLYSSSFYPPGKVADFFGFQYMRDNDQSESGHNTDYLTKAAWHTMRILDESQLQLLIDLAVEQEPLFREYALGRLVLIKAFHRYLDGDLPEGKECLDLEMVKKVSSELYKLDARISYGRAVTFAGVIKSLSDNQVKELKSMGDVGMQAWSMPERPRIKLPAGMNVWVMSNASEMFSWYLRGVEADTYFCPERQGTYFGGFFMKDAPAVGNPGYAIDPQATASKGAAMLSNVLTSQQAGRIRAIYPSIATTLDQIVTVREQISKELRRALGNETPDRDLIMSLCGRYGQLDAIYNHTMVEAFVGVERELSIQQKDQMMALRDLDGYPDKEDKVFLYSREMDLPVIPDTDFLFR